MLATQDLQGSEVGEELRRVLHERDLLDLRASDLAARFAATRAYDNEGYASPIDWIRFNCHLTSNAAADLIAVGKNLQRMPASTQAVFQGEIGFAHVKAMARTANAVGNKFDEALLLEKARENSPGKFYYICHLTGMPLTAKALRQSGRSWWRTVGSGSASAKTAASCSAEPLIQRAVARF